MGDGDPGCDANRYGKKREGSVEELQPKYSAFLRWVIFAVIGCVMAYILSEAAVSRPDLFVLLMAGMVIAAYTVWVFLCRIIP